MPPKKKRPKGGRGRLGEMKKPPDTTIGCRLITPGPQYKLKPLVGYKNHCISKYRNPAYTFGGTCLMTEMERSPGPKYKIKERKIGGYSFGLAAKRCEIESIGPKYKLPATLGGPYFSMKWRTKERKVSETPGPYYDIKSVFDGPAFSIGLHTPVAKCIPTPGFYSYNVDPIKPKAPKYTITLNRPLKLISRSPGPIYTIPPAKPTRAYSFGVKHSDCAPPYITRCDDQC